MKTKILSILLVLTLMLSICSVSVFADGSADEVVVEDMPSKVITARTGAVTVDGIPEATVSPDVALTTDQTGFARVGATWDEATESVYLAVHSEQYTGTTTRAAGFTTFVRIVEYADTEHGVITGVKIEFDDVVYELDGDDFTNPADEALAAEYMVNEDEIPYNTDKMSPLAVGAYAEFKIPLKALDVFRDANGNVYTPVKITVTTNYIVEETFDGAIEFTMNKIAHSSNMTGWYSGIGGLAPYSPQFGTGSGGATEDDTYSKWTTPIANPNNGVSRLASRLDFDKDGVQAMQQFLLSDLPHGNNPTGTTLFMTKNQAVEIMTDFQMSANAPISAPFVTEDFAPDATSGAGDPVAFLNTTGNGFRALMTFGFDGMRITGGIAQGRYRVVIAVYNTADGLRLYLDDSTSPYGGEGVALGKNAGDIFKLSFEMTPNLDLAGVNIASMDIVVKVDGVTVGTLTQTETHAGVSGYRTVGTHFGIACDKLDAPIDDIAYVNYWNFSVSNTEEGNVRNIIRDLVATYTEDVDAPVETTTTKLVFTQKPVETTTKKATTTTPKAETTTTEAATTTAAEAKKGGCPASIAVTGVTMMLGSATIALIATSKKKED